MMRYAVGVGSNRGDRRAIIDAAAVLMTDGIALIARSTMHETVPVGGPGGQEHFLNAVWIIETELGPHQLLHRLQRIETALGRVRTVHWGPRTLDLDLLLREDGLEIRNPVLTLPHPLWRQRAFVREPLAEVSEFLKR